MEHINIRFATLDDKEAIKNHLVKWLLETSFVYPSFNEQFDKWIDNVLNYGFSLIADIGEQGVVGSCGMALSHFPWNSQARIYTNEWFFVEKAYRNKDIAKNMVALIKAISDDTKIPAMFNLINGVDSNLKDRFMQIQSLKYAGGNFVYGV